MLIEQQHGDTQQHRDTQKQYGDTQQQHGNTQKQYGDTQQQHGDTQQQYGDTQQQPVTYSEETEKFLPDNHHSADTQQVHAVYTPTATFPSWYYCSHNSIPIHIHSQIYGVVPSQLYSLRPVLPNTMHSTRTVT